MKDNFLFFFNSLCEKIRTNTIYLPNPFMWFPTDSESITRNNLYEEYIEKNIKKPNEHEQALLDSPLPF
jgi:hypothetical protein